MAEGFCVRLDMPSAAKTFAAQADIAKRAAEGAFRAHLRQEAPHT